MKTLLESSLADRFKICFLNTNLRKSNEQKGKVDLTAIRAFFIFIGRLVGEIVGNRPAVAYYFVTATRLGWLGRDIWCILVCRILRVPVVLHMRAGHFGRNFGNMGRVAQGIIKLVCRMAAKGLVQANGLRGQFKGLMSEERIHVVYNAIDTNKYLNPEPELYDSLKILYLGHLSCAKGYCDVMKAIPKLAVHHDGVIFIFAGSKISEERNVFYNEVSGEKICFEDPDECYETYVKGRFDKNYRYMGLVGEDEKIGLLRECNFLLLPSYSEGFSMAVLEAISMAKPVVCSPVGALGEVIRNGENGLLVAPGDVDAMVEGMDRLIRDRDLRNAMAWRNHEYARKMFAVEVVASQLGEHLMAVIDRAGDRWRH